jgi:DNA polymerase I
LDLEWRSNSNNEIYCACLHDYKDQEILLHENHYKGYSEPHKAFMKDILNAMLQYSVIVGHAILNEKYLGKDGKTIGIDSDLKILEQNCMDVGLVREFESVKSQVKFIDTFNIFSNNAIKASLSAINIDYRTNSLEDIAQAYISEGKLEHLNGAKVESLHESKQLEYCITDCHLVMRILRKNDWEILKILLNLSKEIGMPFLETCNARFPTRWWAHKLKSREYTVPEKIRITKIPYEGALVLEPVVGIHRDVITLDISAMYPTMADIYNLSSETINCSCCVDSDSARISEQVMNSINEGLLKLDPPQQPREWHYWICQQRRGKFAKIQHDLIEKKEQYKSLKLKTAEKATKLFANSGYGAFGHFGFAYYDPRIAELVTGHGRITLKGLVSLISDPSKYNLPVLYGDTDSLFVANGAIPENTQRIENFLSEAQETFKIKVSKEKALKILVLTRNKKQYFGINFDGEPISKTMVGMKSDKTLYCQQITSRLISPEFIEPFMDESNLSEARERVLLFVKASFAKLESKILAKDLDFIKHKLAYSLKASRPLDTYNNEGIHKEIYREIIEEAASQNNINIDNSFFAGERVYCYYKIYPMYENGHKKSITFTLTNML